MIQHFLENDLKNVNIPDFFWKISSFDFRQGAIRNICARNMAARDIYFVLEFHLKICEKEFLCYNHTSHISRRQNKTKKKDNGAAIK